MSYYSLLAHMQSKILAPMGVASGVFNNMYFKNPFNPMSYTPWGQQTSMMLQTFEDAGKIFGERRLNISEVRKNGITTKVTQKVVLKKPYCNFVLFTPQTATQQDPVLFVPPVSGQRPGPLAEDYTKALLLEGKPVLVAAWKDPKHVPLKLGSFGLNKYVHYLSDAVDYLGERSHAIVICQACTPFLMMLALREKQNKHVPLTGTLVSGPIDPKAAPTAITRYVDQTNPNQLMQLLEKIPTNCGYRGEGQIVFPEMLQLAGFLGLAPSEHYKNFNELCAARLRGDQKTVNKILSSYDKVFSTQNIPGELIGDILNDVFINALFPKGLAQCDGESITGSMIRNTALLAVGSEDDKAVDIKQLLAAKEICYNAKSFESLILKYLSHFDTIHGKAVWETIVPTITRFQNAHTPAVPEKKPLSHEQIVSALLDVPNPAHRKVLLGTQLAR